MSEKELAIAIWIFIGWLVGAAFPHMSGGIWTRLTWPLWLPLFCLSRSGRWTLAAMRALRRELPGILRLAGGREVPPFDERRSGSGKPPPPPPARKRASRVIP